MNTHCRIRNRSLRCASFAAASIYSDCNTESNTSHRVRRRHRPEVGGLPRTYHFFRMFFVIPLVILFGRIKSADRPDMRTNRLRITASRFQALHHLPSRLFLFRRVEKNNRTVLRSEIDSLPIWCRGIMGIPENFQQVFVGNNRRIESDLHNLRMTGGVGADLFVGRIRNAAAHVAANDFKNAPLPPKQMLDAPKATAAKSCEFHSVKREDSTENEKTYRQQYIRFHPQFKLNNFGRFFENIRKKLLTTLPYNAYD